MSEQKKRKKIKKPQSLLDKITMGPLERYIEYDSYPTKLLIHIIVIALSTAQILLITNYTAGYSRAAERVWNEIFMDEQMYFDRKFPI